VRVGECYSRAANVSSGVIQGSTLGPVLYDLFIDSLLRKLKLPTLAFADDVKIVADVATYPASVVQSDINTLADWAYEHGTPLSVEKCSVLHCGLHQPCNNYHINTVALASVDSLRDLGVLRSGDARYHAHCSEVVTKASRMCGVIRRVFNSGHRNALWPAFTTYVQPILSYCTPVWSPHLKGDIAAIEAVQRRFTKKIHGLEHMSYSMRLADLGALSLLNRRRYADLLVTFRYVRGLVNGSLSDIGLELSTAPRGARESD
jgi:ribonuclease P/MRP protein subunit RPP40